MPDTRTVTAERPRLEAVPSASTILDEEGQPVCPVCLASRGAHGVCEIDGPYLGQRTICPAIPLHLVRQYGRVATLVGRHDLRSSGYCICGVRVPLMGFQAHLLLAFEQAGIRVVTPSA